MSVEQNKALVRRVFDEIINQGNLGATDEVLSTRYVNHNFAEVQPGPEGFKQVISMFRSAFPDMKIMIEDVLAEDDKIMTRGYCTGTHHGEFMGIPATGKEVRFGYIDIWRVENGKLTENWVQMDNMSMMQQLGVAPAPK